LGGTNVEMCCRGCDEGDRSKGLHEVLIEGRKMGTGVIIQQNEFIFTDKYEESISCSSSRKDGFLTVPSSTNKYH